MNEPLFRITEKLSRQRQRRAGVSAEQMRKNEDERLRIQAIKLAASATGTDWDYPIQIYAEMGCRLHDALEMMDGMEAAIEHGDDLQLQQDLRAGL